MFRHEPFGVLYDAIARLLTEERDIVLAVSGGLDSMCLLQLVVAARPSGRGLSVATFDHRSSPHGADAVALVRQAGARLGVEVVAGAARASHASEAAWRSVRWAFLRDVAAERNALIATAHTLDDHIETVVMRALRGAGARGLAGLLAPSPGILRPLVGVSRQAIAQVAADVGFGWIDDPTNQSRRYFRNRVRHDLLPALRAVRPTLNEDVLDLSRRAAQWREDADRASMRWEGAGESPGLVASTLLTELDREGRLVAWQSILARRGVVADRRGLSRLAALNGDARTGAQVQLSGGHEVVRLHDGLLVRRSPAPESGSAALTEPETIFGSWLFRTERIVEPAAVALELTPWCTWVSESAEVFVRAWTAGDRLRPAMGSATRRVARFLSDAGIAGPLRRGWPVVVSDGEIVWIPGVRRAFATPVRSGGPIRRLFCERIHR